MAGRAAAIRARLKLRRSTRRTDHLHTASPRPPANAIVPLAVGVCTEMPAFSGRATLSPHVRLRPLCLDAVELRHADVHQDDLRHKDLASATASRPSPASPTTSMSGSARKITRNPARTRARSSASRTRSTTGGATVAHARRNRRRDGRPTRAHRSRSRRVRASDEASRFRGGAVTRAVVDDGEIDGVGAVGDSHAGRVRPRRA
jgi:hypothetical protein